MRAAPTWLHALRRRLDQHHRRRLPVCQHAGQAAPGGARGAGLRPPLPLQLRAALGPGLAPPPGLAQRVPGRALRVVSGLHLWPGCLLALPRLRRRPELAGQPPRVSGGGGQAWRPAAGRHAAQRRPWVPPHGWRRPTRAAPAVPRRDVCFWWQDGAAKQAYYAGADTDVDFACFYLPSTMDAWLLWLPVTPSAGGGDCAAACAAAGAGWQPLESGHGGSQMCGLVSYMGRDVGEPSRPARAQASPALSAQARPALSAATPTGPAPAPGPTPVPARCRRHQAAQRRGRRLRSLFHRLPSRLPAPRCPQERHPPAQLPLRLRQALAPAALRVGHAPGRPAGLPAGLLAGAPAVLPRRRARQQHGGWVPALAAALGPRTSAPACAGQPGVLRPCKTGGAPCRRPGWGCELKGTTA